jgi:hypothetical protein
LGALRAGSPPQLPELVAKEMLEAARLPGFSFAFLLSSQSFA